MMTGGGIYRTLVLSNLDPEHWQTEEDGEGSDIFAVRLRNLGLTAYGATENEAHENVRKLLHAFIAHLVDHNMLEDTLRQAGVDWEWEDPTPKARWRRGTPPETIDRLPVMVGTS